MLWIPDGFNGFTQDSELVGRWVVKKAGGMFTEGCTGIGLIRDGVLVAGVMYNGYTGIEGSISMHGRVDDPRATNRWFYRVIFDYPFNQLKVKRCNALVVENNEHALLFNEKLGFCRDTVIKDYFPMGDAIIMKMYKDDCKWLKERGNDEKLVTRDTSQ